MCGYRCAAGRNVAGDAVSLAEQAGGLLTGSKVSRNFLGNVLTGAASAARRTVGSRPATMRCAHCTTQPIPLGGAYTPPKESTKPKFFHPLPAGESDI